MCCRTNGSFLTDLTFCGQVFRQWLSSWKREKCTIETKSNKRSQNYTQSDQAMLSVFVTKWHRMIKTGGGKRSIKPKDYLLCPSHLRVVLSFFKKTAKLFVDATISFCQYVAKLVAGYLRYKIYEQFLMQKKEKLHQATPLLHFCLCIALPLGYALFIPDALPNSMLRRLWNAY